VLIAGHHVEQLQPEGPPAHLESPPDELQDGVWSLVIPDSVLATRRSVVLPCTLFLLPVRSSPERLRPL
jgi:hypothetical protein